MKHVLVTAFEPYDRWHENSSWRAICELTRDLPATPTVTTRKYPVDFGAVREKLVEDFRTQFDFAIFLGQAPGANAITLESTALNIRPGDTNHDSFRALEIDGPAAFSTALPITAWTQQLRGEGIPTIVSHHAGTYLCNAIYYWGQWIARRQERPCHCLFIHIPLSPEEVVAQPQLLPSMPTTLVANAVRRILEYCDHLVIDP